MSTIRHCPVCAGALEIYDHEGVELDRCGAGHGIWFDRGELPQVVRSEQAPRTPEERAEAAEAATNAPGAAVVAESEFDRRKCPVCATPMTLTEYAGSGIAIDECPRHGVWLDTGELERIEAYGEAMRRQGTSSDPEIAVRGVQIPPELLQGISKVPVPPPAPPSS
jgi:Zn-finger nucleic acid-binding protein